MEKVIALSDERAPDIPFEALVDPHLNTLYRLAFRFTGNGPDAEDLVQEVLVKLLPRHRQLLSIDRLRPWLVRVLYNTFIDQRRRAARSPLRLWRRQDGSDEGDDLDTVPAPDADPAAIAEQRFTREQLLQAVKSLNDHQRALCMLHDVEGYTLSELATMLATPIGTLKSRLHRARARLRQILAEEAGW